MLVSGELRCFLTMCLLTVVVYLLLRGHSVHCQPPGIRTIIASTSGSGDIEVSCYNLSNFRFLLSHH